MKYLNRLFAFDDRQSHQQSSAATLTSSLYSVTFTPESTLEDRDSEHRKKKEQLLPSTSSAARIAIRRKQINLIAQASGVDQADSWEDSLSLIGGKQQSLTADKSTRKELAALEEQTGVIGYLLSATIGKSIAKQNNPSTSKTKVVSQFSQQAKDRKSHISDNILTTDDDWILVDEDLDIDHRHNNTYNNKDSNKSNRITSTTKPTIRSYSKVPLTQLKQMALENTDIELIKGSWIPVRKDTTASGVLLFKGLFVKFPKYKKFFTKFSDIDVERMHENKRLLSHAVRVIDTVTFVVDSLGDVSKTSQLNDALVKLVKSHLKRKIGLTEFRNLGIVLIDFICDVVGRGGAPSVDQRASDDQYQLNKSSTSESINTNSSSIDSETMTSALDKLRASSSPSSSSEEESYLSPQSSQLGTQSGAAANNLNDISISSSSSKYATKLEENNDGPNIQQEVVISGSRSSVSGNSTKTSSSSASSSSSTNIKEAKIDTNLHLVAAWTKLYNIILDLVKQEEAAAGE